MTTIIVNVLITYQGPTSCSIVWLKQKNDLTQFVLQIAWKLPFYDCSTKNPNKPSVIKGEAIKVATLPQVVFIPGPAGHVSLAYQNGKQKSSLALSFRWLSAVSSSSSSSSSLQGMIHDQPFITQHMSRSIQIIHYHTTPTWNNI